MDQYFFYCAIAGVFKHEVQGFVVCSPENTRVVGFNVFYTLAVTCPSPSSTRLL